MDLRRILRVILFTAALLSGASRALALQSSLTSVAFNPASGLVTGQPFVFIGTVDPATGSGPTPTGPLNFKVTGGG